MEQRIDGRTAAARQAKAAAQMERAAAQRQAKQDAAFHALLGRSDIKLALATFENAKARRDSVSRKLVGGSSFVTVSDLAPLEEDLASAASVLVDLAAAFPLLRSHPLVAAASIH